MDVEGPIAGPKETDSAGMPDQRRDFLIRLAISLRILALVPAFVLLVPVQWLLVRFNLSWQRTLPLFFHRYLLRVLGVRVTTKGEPGTARPLLIVSNHVSWLDIVVIGSLFPLSFIAKSEIAGWPLFGLLAKLQRSIFVDRQRRGKTHEINGQIAARLRAGDVMVLFGEGTTSDGGRVLPFRSALLGAARATMGTDAAETTVQGLTIAYTRIQGLPMGRADRPLIAWYGDMNLVSHLAGVLSAGAIDCTVSYGEPQREASAIDRKELTRRLENAVRHNNILALTGRSPASAAPMLPAAAETG